MFVNVKKKKNGRQLKRRLSGDPLLTLQPGQLSEKKGHSHLSFCLFSSLIFVLLKFRLILCLFLLVPRNARDDDDVYDLCPYPYEKQKQCSIPDDGQSFPPCRLLLKGLGEGGRGGGWERGRELMGQEKKDL